LAWTAADLVQPCAAAAAAPQKNHDVYAIAASIHAKYTKNNGLAANDLSYGVALIPKKGGFIVAAVR
jgi:hypothetical protein